MPNLQTNVLARIETVTPQQAAAFAAARGVRVDSRKQLLKSLRIDGLDGIIVTDTKTPAQWRAGVSIFSEDCY
ncbi:hypothetical protein [uncultured Chryseobacterium sp.]|uniref:hypothetical protein n=1 Tax=uncultured Chryseobacterium sp. TaxID=259322 RepID=UPI0025E85A3E|nr:hypothetical protein [uncultured Chryseobacterium sp.]